MKGELVGMQSGNIVTAILTRRDIHVRSLMRLFPGLEPLWLKQLKIIKTNSCWISNQYIFAVLVNNCQWSISSYMRSFNWSVQSHLTYAWEQYFLVPVQLIWYFTYPSGSRPIQPSVVERNQQNHRRLPLDLSEQVIGNSCVHIGDTVLHRAHH